MEDTLEEDQLVLEAFLPVIICDLKEVVYLRIHQLEYPFFSHFPVISEFRRGREF